jgi:hypothetical protein
MEATCSSETSIDFEHTTQRYITESEHLLHNLSMEGTTLEI